ncbi:hypothetical protein PH586_21510 [Pseudomonas sp. SA3-5]|uniref:tRNA_anti-like n=1 Tax=Pseudomonas aestuarii TaxID=3018340 RepID=A0ABT4XLG9_9PSED|nr:hypothetical protein [Pseudomonas aestuarii]MDA7088963.1 hypothetical protein [Pseudomonas aestuarii]
MKRTKEQGIAHQKSCMRIQISASRPMGKERSSPESWVCLLSLQAKRRQINTEDEPRYGWAITDQENCPCPCSRSSIFCLSPCCCRHFSDWLNVVAIAKQPAPAQAQFSALVNRSVGFWLGMGIFLFPIIFAWFLLRQGHSTTSRVIGFAWLALVLVGMASSDRPASTPTAATSGQSQPAKVVAPVEPLIDVSAQQLAQAYDRNTVAADQQFKDKRFKVTGVVDAINTDMFGNPYVTLRGGVNQFMEPQFELDDAHANYAAGLQSGMHISLICKGRGDVAKTPMSDECAPAN